MAGITNNLNSINNNDQIIERKIEKEIENKRVK